MQTEVVKSDPEIKKLTPREESRRSSLSKLISTARRLFVELGYEAATVRKSRLYLGLEWVRSSTTSAKNGI